MAEELNDYGPAFPIAGTHYGEVQWHHGISKREYYAAHAPEIPMRYKVKFVNPIDYITENGFFKWRRHYAEKMVRGEER